VRTAVFVRGLVQPVREGTVAGLRCHYLRGKIGGSHVDEADLEPITRVELTSPPASWDQDLVLEPGAPAAVTTAHFLADLPLGCFWAASGVLGTVLALFLPWVVLPKETRRLADWVWAAGVGASLCLSILAAALVFVTWRLKTTPHGGALSRP